MRSAKPGWLGVQLGQKICSGERDRAFAKSRYESTSMLNDGDR